MKWRRTMFISPDHDRCRYPAWHPLPCHLLPAAAQLGYSVSVLFPRRAPETFGRQPGEHEAARLQIVARLRAARSLRGSYYPWALALPPLPVRRCVNRVAVHCRAAAHGDHHPGVVRTGRRHACGRCDRGGDMVCSPGVCRRRGRYVCRNGYAYRGAHTGHGRRFARRLYGQRRDPLSKLPNRDSGSAACARHGLDTGSSSNRSGRERGTPAGAVSLWTYKHPRSSES